MTNQVTPELLGKIADAFNRNDVEAIVGHFHDEGVLINGRGPAETGDIYAGKEKIRAFFTETFATLPNIRWETIPPNLIAGDRAVVNWRRVAAPVNGVRQDWLGCDQLTFKDGLILKKDSYIKVIS